MTTAAVIRISDLAKELKMTIPELASALKELGIETKGTITTLDADTADTVRSLLAKTSTNGKIAEVSADATVKDIALAIGIQPNVAQKKLMELGGLFAVNQHIPRDLADRLASAYGYTLRLKAEPKPEPKPAAPSKHKSPGGTLQPRPPVVTIMGHVDHGKTSLLDMIRQTNVVAGEFGGITQHIGAYQVEVEHNGAKEKITFLDTPGHAAFTAMRARGASVTDIVVLVVAADDGIMPQTIEAIQHAQAAKVPIIVAINKIDKPDANPDRIKQQLTEHNLVVEDYGGDTIAVPVSAKTGDGIADLLEYILLVAEVQELRADPQGHASGTIIEARMEPGRGPVATMLVQQGTLRIGDNVVAGLAFGKIRAMTNERGERLQKAGPATPVEILGLNIAPSAGDSVEVVKNDKEARIISERRQQKARQSRLSGGMRRLTFEDISRQALEGSIKNFNLVVKADVQGSLEAVLGQLSKLEENKTEDEVRLNVKLSGVGNVSESDVQFALATDSLIIGFNVRTDPSAQRAIEHGGVEVRLYNIIYDLTEDLEKAMKGMLTPIFEEFALGKAEVRQRFRTPRGVVIAGSYVVEGKMLRGADARVRRGRDILYTGRIDSLRHIKEDVREMAQGFECGIVLEDWTDIQEGDIVECFEMRQIERH